MEQNRLVISTNWFGYQNIMFTDRKTVQKLNMQKQTAVIKNGTTAFEIKAKRWNATRWWWLSQKLVVIVLLEYLKTVLSWFSMAFFNQSHGHDETWPGRVRTEEGQKYHHIAYVFGVHLEETKLQSNTIYECGFCDVKIAAVDLPPRLIALYTMLAEQYKRERIDEKCERGKRITHLKL